MLTSALSQLDDGWNVELLACIVGQELHVWDAFAPHYIVFKMSSSNSHGAIFVNC